MRSAYPVLNALILTSFLDMTSHSYSTCRAAKVKEAKLPRSHRYLVSKMGFKYRTAWPYSPYSFYCSMFKVAAPCHITEGMGTFLSVPSSKGGHKIKVWAARDRFSVRTWLLMSF